MNFLKAAQRKQQQGFTIIELLFATIVFSVVLLVMTTAFIKISQLYYKGINMANTQDDTRSALTDIGNDIQFAGSAPPNVTADVSHSPTGSFCIGGHRYAYYIGTQVGSGSKAGIYRQGNGTCPPSIDFTKPVEQLLGNGMQLNYLYLKCDAGACTIHLHVIFYEGDPDGLFSSASTPKWKQIDSECTGSLTGSQFCATADYERTVLQSP